MTRKPVTVTADQMKLIKGATDIGLYSSRSAFLRQAFREYFATNEVLLAVLLAEADDIDVRDVVTSVNADQDVIYDLLDALGSPVDQATTDGILEEIEGEIAPPEPDDSS